MLFILTKTRGMVISSYTVVSVVKRERLLPDGKGGKTTSLLNKQQLVCIHHNLK